MGNTNNELVNKFKFTAKSGDTNDVFYFDGEETRYYVLVENDDGDPTIDYDTNQHHIKVDVTANRNQGGYDVSITEISQNEYPVVVTNDYDAKHAGVTVGVQKHLTNATGVDVPLTDFTFGLYSDRSCTNKIKDVTIGASGYGEFSLEYTDADFKPTLTETTKTYTYYLRENVSDKYPEPYMTYDKSVYEIKVTLSYDSNKHLVARETVTRIVDQSGNTVSAAANTPQQALAATIVDFYNEYKFTGVPVNISGNKSFTGSWAGALADKNFTIELYKTSANGDFTEAGHNTAIATTNVNKKRPMFNFTGDVNCGTGNYVPQLILTSAGKHYFVVRELHGGLTGSQTSDNDDGNVIYDGKQYVIEITVGTVKTNNVVTGLDANITKIYQYGYPNTELQMNNIVFTNIDTSGNVLLDIIGKKLLNGETEDRPIVDKEFDFVLTETDSTWTPKPDGTVIEVVNRENREEQRYEGYNVEFIDVPMNYTGTEPMYFYFTVEELDTGIPAIGFDTTKYKIKVKVEYVIPSGAQKGEAKITAAWLVDENTETEFTVDHDANKGYNIVLAKTDSASGTTDNAFVNTYSSVDTETEIDILKKITNTTGVELGKEGYSFGLYTKDASGNYVPVEAEVAVDGDGKNVYTPAVNDRNTVVDVATTSAKDGTASIKLKFTDVHYDKAGTDKTYTYYLKEFEPVNSLAGMDYDDTVYEVNVALSYNALHKLN
ncbi:MAG: hypothetical protein IJW74_03945, partial [Oscillospiraceae bacterium]|nr:hypothetical protein [Oscillospiraceae bacterium]